MEIKIEKLIFGGQGLGKTPEGQIVFVWNALPGETVEVEITKTQKGFLEGTAKKILNPSPHRETPLDPHFLSTGPWQNMDYETELLWKKNIALETYQKLSGLNISELEIVSTGSNYGYRNKIEFNFSEDENHKAILAFHERGKRIRIGVKGSALAEPVINDMAEYILNWINEEGIALYSLKSLILRSNTKGQVIAALFIKDKLKLKTFPSLNEKLIGLQIFYSTHKSPASVPTELLYNLGQNYLENKILNTTLRHGVLSFFQINVPVFCKALEDIQKHLDNDKEILDFYSGVGAISLPVAKPQTKITLVDNSEEGIYFAKENIQLNKKNNCEALCIPAEKITELITSSATLIVDPPRTGLNPKVTEKILEKLPPKIIYLSCDIATQARDLKLLLQEYQIEEQKIYNFFPKTPHIEGLVVMKKK